MCVWGGGEIYAGLAFHEDFTLALLIALPKTNLNIRTPCGCVVKTDQLIEKKSFTNI